MKMLNIVNGPQKALLRLLLFHTICDIIKVIPHRACAEDALSDFSSDRIEIPQAYYRMSRDFCAR